ncbi:lipopolysaccharide biosynthesis protein [Aliarcobacter butzleri]
MNKQVIIYVFSTAIDKGSIFLFFPLILKFLSLEEFGIWSLIMIVSSLLTPIVSLNGSSSILREGSENVSIGKYILKFFIIYTLFIGGSFSFLLFFIDNLHEKWLFYSFVIATIEGVLILVLTFLRTQNKSISYLIINLLKVSFLLILIIYSVYNKLEFNQYLYIQVIIMGIFTLLIMFITFYFDSNEYKEIALYTVIVFAVSLIPHVISQWIMSSSDRLIIEYMLDTKSVGIYSLSYNIAQILTLINMGLGLALPTYLIKNYLDWKKKNFDNIIIKYYTYIAIFLFVFIYILYYVDYKYFNVLKYYNSEMLNLISINYFAIYILGLYTFYANYLFYHRKGKIISIVTFYAALVNILFSVFLIYIFGLIGASIGTLIAYVFYLYYIIFKTQQIEIDLNIKLIRSIVSIVLAIIILRIGISYVIY